MFFGWIRLRKEFRERGRDSWVGIFVFVILLFVVRFFERES